MRSVALSTSTKEVTLSRKGAKSGTRARKLRSTGTKARTPTNDRNNVGAGMVIGGMAAAFFLEKPAGAWTKDRHRLSRPCAGLALLLNRH
jgi:hypothetical protein